MLSCSLAPVVQMIEDLTSNEKAGLGLKPLLVQIFSCICLFIFSSYIPIHCIHTHTHLNSAVKFATLNPQHGSSSDELVLPVNIERNYDETCLAVVVLD